MSTENQNQPMFSLQKIYIKDLSFENPNAPQVFTGSDNQPQIKLDLGVEHRQVSEQHWEVSLKINVIAMHSKDESVLFEVEVEQAAIFLLQNIPEEHIPVVLGVDCPTILYPYTRQIISSMTTEGGFMPLLLEPFNFASAFQNSQQQAQQEAN